MAVQQQTPNLLPSVNVQFSSLNPRHRGITRSLSARRWEGGWIDARPKLRHSWRPTKKLYLLLICQMHDINSMSSMHWLKTGETQYHAHLGFQDKGRVIKRLVVCNHLDLEPLNMLNCLAPGFYQPFPGVLIVSITDQIWEQNQITIKSPENDTNNTNFNLFIKNMKKMAFLWLNEIDRKIERVNVGTE